MAASFGLHGVRIACMHRLREWRPGCACSTGVGNRSPKVVAVQGGIAVGINVRNAAAAHTGFSLAGVFRAAGAQAKA